MSKKDTIRHYEHPCNGYAIRHISDSDSYRVEHPVEDTLYYTAHSLNEARSIANALPSLYGCTPAAKPVALAFQEDEIYVTDKGYFGDENDHLYNCTCFDGFAICVLADKEDKKAPAVIRQTYPKRREIIRDRKKVAETLGYRGLDDVVMHYGDIMIAYGKVDHNY